MRIALGADHAGYPLKEQLSKWLAESGHAVYDLGTHSAEPVDYPDFAAAVAQAVLDGRADRGILICGSGAGAAVAANKLHGIRSSIAHDTYTAHQMVEHDDVNVLCLGARVIGPALWPGNWSRPSSRRVSRAKSATSDVWRRSGRWRPDQPSMEASATCTN